MFAVGKTLADVKLHGASSDLVKAVVADLETAEARQQSTLAELQGKTPDQVRTAALTQWLVSVGHKVAQAAKEGGVLGFGWTRFGASAVRAGRPGADAEEAQTLLKEDDYGD